MLQWSLGVILFELVAGQPPFYTNSIVSLVKLIVQVRAVADRADFVFSLSSDAGSRRIPSSFRATSAQSSSHSFAVCLRK